MARARRQAREVLHLRPARRERAEALTILAECQAQSGKGNEAVREYLQIARAHADLAVGENALAAAARLEARLGHRAAARRLFRDYRKRYPRGRHIQEVTSRLRRL